MLRGYAIELHPYHSLFFSNKGQKMKFKQKKNFKRILLDSFNFMKKNSL